MTHSVERYHDISCGHRVHGHESKCAHLHGHNYRIFFTCVPDPTNQPPQRSFIGQKTQTAGLDNVGRVLDFSAVKERLCMWLEDMWDHKFLVSVDDPMLPGLRALDIDGVIAVPFNPTAENMAQYLVDVVGPGALHGTGVRLAKVRVEETRKCSASYEGSR